MGSPNLALAHIASNQASPEITANAAVDGLDRAGNSQLIIVDGDADYVLAATVFASAFNFTFTGTITASHYVLIPTTNTIGVMQRLFSITNNTSGGFDLVVKVSGSSSVVAVAPGVSALLFSDGVDIFSFSNGSSSLVVNGVNRQTGTGYGILAGDVGKLISLSNAAPQTIFLPAINPGNGWFVWLENTGAGTWTINPNSLLLDTSASTLDLTTNTGVLIVSDGTNYFTCRGLGGGSGVTTTGSPASGNLAKFSGASAITNGDLSGDVTTSGTLAATLAASGVTAGSFTGADITVDAKGRITAASNGVLGINTQTASYTLVLSDQGKLVRMNVGSANNLTVPLNASVAFPVGTVITVRQTGAGVTTIVATGGVTINTPSSLVLRVQNSSVSLVKVATDTWDLAGDTV